VQFTFGGYRLDPVRRELTRGTEGIAIGPQVFDLLVYLVQNRERVVSKDDLLDNVWRGRIVSESTLTSHINAARKAVRDNGVEQRWIRTVSRKGFRFVGEVREEQLDAGFPPVSVPGVSEIGLVEHGLALPDRPSIAVLPFQNLSHDAEQEYFTDGVVEDIITALSRIRWLFVTARNSSFTYKGRAVDIKQVGRELGVRYVLEGSVRKAPHRVRITGQLIDASTGSHVWAERFESTLEDIFELQDQITASVVGATAPQLERAEIERARRKPTESLDAYDHYLRGMAKFHQGTKDGVTGALACFYEAIRLDPEFASAYGMAAWCYFWRKLNRWMTNPSQELKEGAQLARRAVELGKDDAVALTRAGHALGHFGGDLESCIELVDKARVLNPNLSAAWYLGGFQRLARGEPDAALEYFERAMRLSPLDPETVRMQAGKALAHMLAGRFDAASSYAEKAFQELPTFLLVPAIIAASHALAGRMDEGERAMRHLRGLDPTLCTSNLKDWILLRPEGLAVFAKGLRMAGLPE
jgi:TolB-like protein